MKRSEIPSLDDLRAFEAVVRLGGVRAAAEELVLTHGAVSRRIGKLARDLGVRLVEPEGRGIRPTPEGAVLAAAAHAALDQVGEALARIRGAAEGPVVLSCERSIAMRWLIPRLGRFEADHPDLRVHLSVGGGRPDPGTSGAGLALGWLALRRLDFPVEPGWIVEPVVEEAMGPVATAAQLAAFRDGDYVALGSTTRPRGWADWLALHPAVPQPREIRLFDHHVLAAESAVAGLGVALCPLLVVADDLAAGRLTAPEGFAADGSRYGLIRRGTRGVPSTAVARLGDWLKSELDRTVREAQAASSSASAKS
ncbi:LysR family transcriptional regulator [Tistrella mobilis]|uniref:LysR family transcriptional regulator n=1 Tax=Tistrella mobilis TaxID=171437 RepID=UPI0031F68D1E